MSEEELQEVLVQLRQCPVLVVQRRLQTQLLSHIQQSSRLWREPHSDYASALNQTFEWVCGHINDFRADVAPGESIPVSEALMRWVNGHLKYRILDLKGSRLPSSAEQKNDRTDKEYRLLLKAGFRPMALDQPLTDGQGNQSPQGDLVADPRSEETTLLDEWIERLQQSQRERVGQAVRDYIETDPDGLLQACGLRKVPECHCQVLAIRIHLAVPPKTIRSIAEQFGVAEQALYSHWRKKCLPLVQLVALRHDPQIKAYAAADPDERLQACRVEPSRTCSCRDLAATLLLDDPPVPLRTAAKGLGLKESTLTTAWQRQCLPLLTPHRV